jgi:membrane-associated protein
MELITTILEWVLHLDTHLAQIIQQFGGWTYGILFFVIFMETGFVVTPFLPGDSLLFAAGALAASTGAFDMVFLFVLMFIAAFTGDGVNYWIGHTVGPKAFTGTSKLFKKEYLERTQAFYEKHGGKTILLARFIPIIRTFAPFVAGIGKMRYGYFITYNIVGGFLWTGLFLFGGYFFGNLPFVSDNFSFVVIAIILISLIPAVVEVLRNRKPAEKIESETPIE